jgi:hypothetical protein
MAKRSLSVRIHPIFEGELAPSTGWELTAVVRHRVSLATQYLVFADMRVHGAKPVCRKVRASLHVPLARLEATAQPPSAAVRVEPVTGEEGQFDIVVCPDPNLPVGPFKFDVCVTAVTLDSQRHRCGTIAVNGEMQSPIRILPAVVLFGEQPLSTKSEAFVTVRLPSAEWGVDHIATDSPDTMASRSESAEEGVLTYRVSQQFTQPGDHTSAIRFVIRRPDGRREESAVKVHYHGERTGGGPQ